MSKKSYRIYYKFSDVIDYVEAEDEDEARKIADEKLMSDYNPQNDTYCYEIEAEENEDE